MGERLFARRLGSRGWDRVLRLTGVVGALGIVAALVLSEEIAALVGFFVVTVWVNGPLAMFLPAAYEPILIVFGTVYDPVLVAAIGVVGTVYVEGINYFLYARVLETRAFASARESRLVRTTERLFRVAPFWTVWLCSWSPLPYWVVRILAPLARYPVPRYLLATFLGRFPRLWFFAALGPHLRIRTEALVLVTLCSIALFASVILFRMRRGRRALAISPVPVPCDD